MTEPAFIAALRKAAQLEEEARQHLQRQRATYSSQRRLTPAPGTIPYEPFPQDDS
jgi:hypothetical protein